MQKPIARVIQRAAYWAQDDGWYPAVSTFQISYCFKVLNCLPNTNFSYIWVGFFGGWGEREGNGWLNLIGKNHQGIRKTALNLPAALENSSGI